MSEEIKAPEQNAAQEQKPEASEPQLSPRRRSALVTYLAILFAIAFLFVAVMMVAETKRLKTMNQELQNDSQKNAASLTSNINALQEENKTLSERNKVLSSQIEELNTTVLNAEAEKAALQGKVDQLTEEAAAKDAERESMEAEILELSKKAEDAVKVSELLHQALAADEDGDLDQVRELLDQIEPLKELLSETEQELYKELKIA